jgi:thiol-disulfide isomerase/thioredoxin
MNKTLLLCAAAVAVFTGCNRSGMIDATASAPAKTAGSPAGGTAAGNTKKNATPIRISHGQEVEIKDYAAPGKTTIFDFTSEYCPPCRAIAPRLHKLHAERSDIVVVEVDINRPGVQGIDWASPVARQYGLQSIPAFKIYGANGTLMAEGDDATSQVYKLVR